MRARAGAAAGPAVSIDRLEPRVLLSSYTFVPVNSEFSLADYVAAVELPAGYAGLAHQAIGLGDINGDGFDDFAISSTGLRNGDGTTSLPGAVFVYSGQTRQLIRTLSDGSAGFGMSMANVGDMDGDGINDLAVGSPWRDLDRDNGVVETHGAVYVFRGANGEVYLESLGGTAPAQHGYSVAAIGDVNGDGIPDLVIGSPGAGPDEQGCVFIISGATNQNIYGPLSGEARGDGYGYSVWAAFDITGSGGATTPDGIRDIVIGAPFNDAGGANAGRAYLINGADGSLVRTFTGQGAGHEFGKSVGSVAQGNGMSVLVGAPGYISGGLSQRGAVYVFASPTSYNEITRIQTGDNAGERLGEAMRLLGNSPRDNAVTIAVRATGADATRQMYVFEGFLADTADVYARGRLGLGVFTIGDTTGNGFPEVLTLRGDGAAIIRSGFNVWRPAALQGVSPGRNIAWSNGSGLSTGYIIIEGEYTARSRVPGLDNGAILGINDNGLIFGVLPGDAAPLDRYFFLRDGQRTTLRNAVTQTNLTEEQLGTLTFRALGQNGDVLLRNGENRALLLRNGVLTALWEGDAWAVNTAGSILGQRANPGGGTTTVLRVPDGGIIEIPGLINARALAENNVVIGQSEGQLARWQNGQIQLLGAVPNPNPTAVASEWVAFAIADSGAVLADYTEYFAASDPITTRYIYTANGGIRRLGDVIGADGFAFASGGAIVAPFGLGVPVANAIIADGSPLATASLGDALYTLGINSDGQVVVFRTVGATTTARTLDLPSGGGTVTDVELLVDSARGLVHAAVIREGRVFYLAQRPDGSYETVRNVTPAGLQTGEGMRLFTGFTSVDRIVHLMGVTTEHRVYVATLNPNATVLENPLVWKNLSDTDFGGGEGGRVRWAADMTAYIAPWNGLNVAGVNEAGQVQVVWYSPEAGQWSLTNLTLTANGPAFAPTRLAAYVTPWSGLNVAGTDLEGRVVALWWVPQFGGEWVSSQLVGDDALRLDPQSMSAYVTSWGMLNIVGRDTNTGEIAVYWWVPQTNQWIDQRLPLRDEGVPPVVAGQTVAVASGVSTLNLLSRREADGHLVRLFWNPGDEGLWNFQDVTLTATA